MPKQFESWRMKKVKAVERSQDRVVSAAATATEMVLKKATARVVDTFVRTGLFIPPHLNDLNGVLERFYKHVLTTAFDHAEDADSGQEKKRLAKKPLGLPRKLRSLEQVFRDKKYWPKVMKRSRRVAQDLREDYLQKLRKKFAELTPKIRDGELSPEDAKQQLMKSWKASRGRVETIFRTETTNYFAEAQVRFYAGERDIIGFLFDSVRDTARTDICRSRHGLVYRPGTDLLKENTPALHFNCRSHLIPLANTAENRRLLEDPSRDPSKRSVAPLPRGWKK